MLGAIGKAGAGRGNILREREIILRRGGPDGKFRKNRQGEADGRQ